MLRRSKNISKHNACTHNMPCELFSIKISCLACTVETLKNCNRHLGFVYNQRTIIICFARAASVPLTSYVFSRSNGQYAVIYPYKQLFQWIRLIITDIDHVLSYIFSNYGKVFSDWPIWAARNRCEAVMEGVLPLCLQLSCDIDHHPLSML